VRTSPALFVRWARGRRRRGVALLVETSIALLLLHVVICLRRCLVALLRGGTAYIVISHGDLLRGREIATAGSWRSLGMAYRFTR
jgi:hypothetical protein